jgi:uncharacterized protein
MSFVCVMQLEIHLPDHAGLKGKRKEVSSLKAQLQNRFGAAVAEVDHHDLWQRATLSIALVGRDAGPLGEHADALRRFVDARLGDLTRWECRTLATDDLSGS